MPHATRPGDLLAGRYRLVDLLTESGDGRFWRGHDEVLERHVAIHVIAAGDQRAPRLMEAARRSATVHDPRVLRVLDADDSGDVCYVVNEWGWGASLDVIANGTGTLSARKAAWLVAEVADSIGTAHAAGVAHGRLVPENVLVDRTGGVRVIGLCVDAALHGLSEGRPQEDLTDLAGLLYCALTTRWAGASGSNVTPAPRDHGQVLRPRRVRAGIPRPLDAACDVLLHPDEAHRHADLAAEVSSARGLSAFLADFVGDPAGMDRALLASTPDVLPDEELVTLPPVPELTPHDQQRMAGAYPEPPPTEAGAEPRADPDAAPDPDRPTEAGVPIFGEEGDDVSWLERRATPAPPPPFDEPPERPLFAPDPSDGSPARTPRADASQTSVRPRDEYWPWDTGTGVGAAGTGTGLGAVGRWDDTAEGEPVPENHSGRFWLRLAVALAIAAVVAVVALVAVNVSEGRSILGEESTASSTPSATTTPSEAVTATPLTDLSVTVLDPQGTDGGENDDEAPLAVDGDGSTAWTTSGYNDQLGPPPGLKTGVGIVIDLGGPQDVSEIDVELQGEPTSLSLYLTDDLPGSVDGLDPVDTPTDVGTSVTTTLDAPVTASYLTVWLTSLPQDDDGRFRGRVAEVTVRAS
ncbi:MAG: hypothetical protein CMH83_15450 [Nocardioides sp.]|nr:hypothetical protein [Nocardioides sp.]